MFDLLINMIKIAFMPKADTNNGRAIQLFARTMLFFILIFVLIAILLLIYYGI